ncbi:MAG: hypothetical protein K2P67_01295 [Gallionellaceae bacterium]|nr:hypothetical protein [Gallionellaceae bacterium]
MRRYLRILAVYPLLLLVATVVQATGLKGSKHDLSQNGNQICIHCHTPHGASTQDGLKDAPLWNRKITNLDAFTPYASDTMTQTCPTRPSGISLACLSCHDGTGASSAAYNGDQHNKLRSPTDGKGSDADCLKCHWTDPPGYPSGPIYSSALTKMAGPDLRNDHPISMPYPTGNPNYNTPPNTTKGWSDVKLVNGKVECTTCHAVHNPTIVPFLVADNDSSALCFRCHNK